MAGASRLATIGFEATIGDLIASTDARAANVSLRALQTSLGMGLLGRAVLDLSPFGVAAPAIGDPVAIELDAGDGATLVFTGEVGAVLPSTLGMRIIADSPLSRLARLDVEAAYEGQSLGAIVAELLDKAGLEAGEIGDGPTFPSYVLRRGPRAWRHILNLASLCGLDLWCDPEGKVQLQPPSDPEVTRTFTWGADLLELELKSSAIYPDGVEIWGEGSASSKGEEKGHWLAVDLASVSGTAAVEDKDGTLTAKPDAKGVTSSLLRSGALRTGESVKASATAIAKLRAARPVTGFVLAPGAIDVAPGDWIDFEDIPDDHALVTFVTNPLRVRAVHHQLDATSGLRTRLEL